jgi:MerR family transcriptional regulator/heat shock protein HspR
MVARHPADASEAAETAEGREGGRPEGCYVISVAAEMVRLHPQTLRHYERLGLVQPERTNGNIRRYSARDVQRLRRIQQLMDDLGVNLAGVEVILNMHDRMEEQRQELERQLAEQRDGYEAEIRRLRATLERVQREREL